MSQDPNNPNRLDPSAMNGDDFNISTSVVGRFSASLWGTYNFSSGASFDAGISGLAISIGTSSGSGSTVNLDSTVTGRVQIFGLTTLNFSSNASINSTSTALSLTNSGTSPMIVNLDGDITGASGVSAGDSSTVNMSANASITGNGGGGIAISVGDNSTVNFSGDATNIGNGITASNSDNVTANIDGTASISVTSGYYVYLGDMANVTLSAGATLTSGLSGGGVRIGDGGLIITEVDITAGRTAVTLGDDNIISLDAGLFIQSTGGKGITGGSDNVISLSGNITADDDAVELSGNNNTVTVLASGDLLSQTGIGIRVFSSDGSEVTVFGDIFADTRGIAVSNGTDVKLYGTITSGDMGISVGSNNTVTIYGNAEMTTDDQSMTGSSDNVIDIRGGATLSGGVSFASNTELTIGTRATLGGNIDVGAVSELTINGIVNEAVDDAIRISDDTTIVIGQSAVVTALEGDVIYGDDNNVITIDGALISLGDDISAVTLTGNNQVTIGEDGSVTSTDIFDEDTVLGDALYFFGQDNVIIVDGTIIAGSEGIGTPYGNSTITVGSTGVINADDGIRVGNGDDAMLANTVVMEGTLNVRSEGISSSGAADNITVSGIINGTSDTANAPSSATAIAISGDNAVLNVSGTITDVFRGMIMSGDDQTATISGDMTVISRGIDSFGTGGTLTITSDATINTVRPDGFSGGSIGLLAGSADRTVNFDGTINTDFQGINSVQQGGVFNMGGTINALGGYTVSGFTIAPTGMAMNQTNVGTTTALNLTGTINSDGVGLEVNNNVIAFINGTINAATDAIRVFGTGNVFTFGAGANLTGDLSFGSDSEVINLSLATVAEGTNIALGDGSDIFTGSSAGEVIDIGGGDDVVNGAGGVDTVSIFASIGDFAISEVNGVLSLDHTAGGFFDLGNNDFTNVEFFEFLEGIYSLQEVLDFEQGSGSATSGDDLIVGTSLPDTIFGLEGNDTISGGDGDDYIYGEEGDDILNGNAGDDDLTGGEGDDTINGGDGDDFANYNGFIADYTITTSNGVVTVTDNNPAFGDEGTDTLTEVEFIGFFDGYISTASVASFIRGTSAANNPLNGTAAGDTVLGLGGDDVINGLGGADYLFGGAGNDTIAGGNDNDAIFAGADNDTVTGGSGDDELYGQAGNDILTGGGGRDFISGGSGDDTVYADSEDDFGDLYGGSGNDTLYLSSEVNVDYDFADNGFETAFVQNAAGQTLQIFTTAANGNTTLQTLDVDGTQPYSVIIKTTDVSFAGPWETRTQYRNDNNQNYQIDYTFFDGTSQEVRFDLDDAQSYQTLTINRDFAGNLDTIVNLQDNGRRVTTDYDPDDGEVYDFSIFTEDLAGEGQWTSVLDLRNDAGQRYALINTYDNDLIVDIEFDVENDDPFFRKVINTDGSADGNLLNYVTATFYQRSATETYQLDVIGDDDVRAITNFDLDNVEAWATERTRTDDGDNFSWGTIVEQRTATNQTLFVSQTNEGGYDTTDEFDLFNTEVWARRLTYTDDEDLFAWDTITFLYDDTGTVYDQTTVPDM